MIFKVVLVALVAAAQGAIDPAVGTADGMQSTMYPQVVNDGRVPSKSLKLLSSMAAGGTFGGTTRPAGAEFMKYIESEKVCVWCFCHA